MNENTILPNEKMLIDAFQSGEFLHNIFDDFGIEDRTSLDFIVEKCVDLHNAGKIDLLSLVRNSDLEDIGATDFFTGQHFFCKAIPRLKGSTVDIVRTINLLIFFKQVDLM